MYKVSWATLCSFVIILLASCASDPIVEIPTITKISPEQIQLAVEEKDLKSIYEELKQNLETAKIEDYPNEFAMQAEVKERLSELLFNALETKINDSKQSEGIISIPRLKELTVDAEYISELNAVTYAEVSNLITAQKDLTNKKVETTVEQLKNLPTTALREKVNTLKKLYALSGDEQYKTEKDALISSIEKQINNTEKADEDLAEKLSILKIEQPENKVIKNKLAVVNSKLFENRFFAALADDKPLLAYEHFITLTSTEDFETIRSHLHETGETMAEYFNALGSEATIGNKLVRAYNWFEKSKNVQTNLQINFRTTATDLFIERIISSYHKSMKEKEFELALGFLAVIKEFDLQHKILRTETRKTKKKVLQRAILQISTTTFTNSSGAQNFGNNVSAKITQHLFNKLPNDVRIIEREQYDAILREVELSQSSGEERESLVSVDYIITGGVLEAKVDSQKVEGKKTIRIITGSHKIRNPEFEAWKELSEDNREEIKQPPALVMEDIIEDVSIKITKHRKVGVFSLSYRLIDAASGKVILPNSITFTEEFSDTSSEGVELGDFSLPFKLAQLPSDLEILGKLANKAAESVGKELVNELKNPEAKYESDGKLAEEEQNHYNASVSYARAMALSEYKDLPTKDLIKAMINNTIRSRSF